ncbi:MAG: hypothetical protein HY537_08195 [Deltaproteobacteria bacterium]|nr:hypothetical protein [Deltaproteobacteria bacterium]
MKTFGNIVLIFVLASCRTLTTKERAFIDSLVHSDNPPSWVSSTKTGFVENEKHFIRASHTIKGNERVNACYDLARLDANEAILSEIANDVKGRIDNANQSISENAEVVLGKVRSGEFEGRIIGLRFIEQYFERYEIGDVERVDCHVLAEIATGDYNLIKLAVVDKIVQVDPQLKEAILNKQIDFFGGLSSDNKLTHARGIKPHEKLELSAVQQEMASASEKSKADAKSKSADANVKTDDNATHLR